MVVLYVFRDSERDAGVWVVQKWQPQLDVNIERKYFVVKVAMVHSEPRTHVKPEKVTIFGKVGENLE